jgi:tetratricopeptide (TPR) repeat protein
MCNFSRIAFVAVSLGSLHAFAQGNREQARDHYLKGTRAFDLGAYEEAIAEYGAAYRIKDDPALLYNLGQANRLAGHSVEALRLYKVFLSRSSDAPNRAEVEAKIAELQKLVDQQAKTQKSMPPDQVTPPPTVTPTRNESNREEHATASPTTAPIAASAADDVHAGRTKKISGLAVGAVGAAALATGIAFGVLANNAGNDLSRVDQQMGVFDASKQRTGQTDQLIEGVMLGVGGAALVAGVVVYVLGHREARVSRLKTALVVPLAGAGHAGAALNFGF